ncbi:MAG: sugar-transfer associated ATP-grasp domain-containing protein [Algibacter sp.]|uniref:sugar-transfer associated ATP-grasp domain-containing protein n=1 Tax=Algibacter sp. TaxID=1872428 RepID=UPI00261AB8C4|nr:sugar-transfer associated ATP-grasp domain-containing protein [Algibacter sp.]MDG1730911.1 sugar-transfer associated ATP-grasp domain-containing protein [Algibacter sp.]MDG2179413.1 sugar-transfer associated ATP-grasp domain-containing protein [Algibacter sp.]
MYIYHSEQNEEAYRIRRLVENEKGKLSSKNIKLCKEYALDIFGNKKYTPWLMTYCAYSHEFKEGWIPDNYYGEYVVPALNGEYGTVCNRALVINKLLNDKNSTDIGYYINNLFLSTSNEVLDVEAFKKLLFENNVKVVFKIENSLQGKGIYFFDEKSFDVNYIKQLGNGVFQSFIKQHSFFNQFNDSAVATIRLTSVCKDDGAIEVRAGYFRFGRTGDTHVLSSRQMRIPINIKNGTLLDVAFYPKSESTKRLPDNDIDFAGMELPLFSHCVSEIKRMHSLIPFIQCIGWDIIIDKNNNLKVIELNGGHNGITFNEMVQGPCFKGLGWEKLYKI